MYTYAATAVISASLAFTGAWQIQDWRHTQKESENAAIRAQEMAATSDAATAKSTTVIKVQNARTARAGVLRADAGVAADSRGMLLDSANAALRRASESLAACTALGDSQNLILAECSSELTKVAADADAWAADAEMMRDAWPE